MLDRTIAPPFNTVDHVDVPRAQLHELSSGLPLHYIDAGEQEVLKLEVINRSGSFFEAKPGVSFFTSKMLTEGTAQRKSGEIADFFDFYGAQIDIQPGLDFSSISLYLLREHFGKVLPVFNEILNGSIFPKDELEHQKQLKRENLLVNMEKNQFLSSRKIREAIFGLEHPYGRSLEADAIENVQQDDLKAYYNNFFNSTELVISGMVKAEELKVIDDHLHLPVTRHELKPEASGSATQKEISIERPESLQSSIRMGKKTLNKKEADYINLLVTNEILGGYFGSRLMKNIREEKGFTYGISSNVMNLASDSILVIGTDVKKENTQETIEEIHKEIRLLQNEPVPAGELETVKNYMQGAFLSSITTPFSLADKFKAIHFHGLGYEFYQDYLDCIRSVDTEAILKIANEHLQLEDFSTVVVGGKLR